MAAATDVRQDWPNPTRMIANYFQLSNSAANAVQPAVNFTGGAVASEIGWRIPCNLSDSRKRSRENEERAFTPTINHEHHGSSSSILTTHSAAIPTGLRLSLDDFRQSASNASTSGRDTAGSTSVMSIVYEELQSQLSKQTEELEQLINILGERMRLVLEEKTLTHDRARIFAIEECYTKHLRWKDELLAEARRRNVELKEKAKQASVQLQLWQELAKNRELAAINLRKSLQQLAAKGRDNQQQAMAKEGWGESHGGSCHVGDYEETNIVEMQENTAFKEQRTCRICKTNDMCILLLPCRHLCLCKDCEAQRDACPVCGTKKSASVQVYLC